MMNTSKPILFFGTEDFSATSLTGLIDGGFRVAAVITKPDTPKGRGQQLHAPLVKQIAEQHHIPVWQPKSLSEISHKIRALQPIAGVLVSYGKIVPQSIIDLFTPGIINLHPSLLPRYRGPSPIEAAILNGDKSTGISIMQLTAAMDAGPVYHQAPLHLQGDETKPLLYTKLADYGTVELIATLPKIFNGSLQPIAQDNNQATYCPLLTKSDSLLDPATLTATEAERRVRAYLGFPRTKIVFNGQPVIITKAHVTSEPAPLSIQFADGRYLAVDEVIAPSGKTMTAEAYLRGHSL